MSYTNGLDKPDDYFNTKLYTGNATARSITGVGFQPDWVWIKCRSVNHIHLLFDSIRGTTNYLRTNGTNAEATASATLTAFDSDGFTLGNDDGVNQNTATFASWNWKAGGTASSNTDGSITSSVSANTTAGFSIVSYTGTGANATVGHGLGSAPKVVIVKDRDNANAWVFGSDMVGWTGYLLLNSTNASATNSINWQDTAPTSSVFSVGTNTGVNNTGGMIAYCFAEKKGYSKFGSYTGNGSTTDGSFVYTGHSVAWVMIKQSNEARDWVIYDNKRDAFNVKDNFLVPNSSNAEGSGNTSLQIDFLSNGFKLRGGNHALNKSGGSYIFMSFAESPFVTSTGVPTCAR